MWVHKATQSDFGTSEDESFDSRESKYDYTDNLVAFLASINLDCNLLKDIKSNDNSKCKFDNLKVSYNVLLEESLKTKAKNLKVNNKVSKINVINDSLKSENVDLLNEISNLSFCFF